MKKGQVSMEFSILLAIMFMVFLAYLGVIYQRTYDVAKASDRQLIEQIGDKISIEIDTAVFAEDGFRHRFEIPATIRGKEYNITFCPKFYDYKNDEDNTVSCCNNPGTCIEPAYIPEISVYYIGQTVDYVNTLPRLTVARGDAFTDPTGIRTEICLRKENGALYINHPDFLCP